MRTRLVIRLLRACLRQFPSVPLLGPRHCVKTTLARALGGAITMPSSGVRGAFCCWAQCHPPWHSKSRSRLRGAYRSGRLAPWSGNIVKRLAKSPKVYLRDSGLLHALLRVESRTELLRHPAAGASWEGFAIEQILSTLAAHGIDNQANVLRTSDGYEIDLLLAFGATRVALEMKLSANVSGQDLARLERAADLVRAEHRYIVCQTASPTADATRGVLTIEAAIDRLLRIGKKRAA